MLMASNEAFDLQGKWYKTNSQGFLSEANSWPDDKKTGDIAALACFGRPFRQ